MQINSLYNINRWTLIDSNNNEIGMVIKKTESQKSLNSVDTIMTEDNINIEDEVKVKTLKKESFKI